MSERDKYFKGQQEGEFVHCFWRKHWISLLRELVYFSLFLGFIAVGIVYSDVISNILVQYPDLKLFLAVGVVFIAFYIHRFFIKMINYFLEIGIITNIRIIDHQRSLYFKDIMDSIDMAQIQNIERVGDGILPNLLGYGDITVFLTASSAVKHLTCLPNVKYHFRAINRQNEMRKVMLSKTTQREHEPPQNLREDISKQVNHTIDIRD